MSQKLETPKFKDSNNRNLRSINSSHNFAGSSQNQGTKGKHLSKQASTDELAKEKQQANYVLQIKQNHFYCPNQVKLKLEWEEQNPKANLQTTLKKGSATPCLV